MRRTFLAPSVFILIALFAAPLAIICAYSVFTRGVYGGVFPTLTLENYTRLADSLYAAIALRTVIVASFVTLICLVLGFPLALFLTRSGKRKHLYLQLVMLPFWTSFLVRTYAWMFLLRDTGLINTLLLALGLIREPLPLLYNEGAVVLGLVYGHLPFAIIPLYANLERLDRSLLEAASDLGAKPWDSLTRVLIPLCGPGFRAAALLVFIPSLGAYLTPDLLGGGKSIMLGSLIQNQFTTARDWPFGSAISIAVMAVIVLCLFLWMRSSKEELL